MIPIKVLFLFLFITLHLQFSDFFGLSDSGDKNVKNRIVIKQLYSEIPSNSNFIVQNESFRLIDRYTSTYNAIFLLRKPIHKLKISGAIFKRVNTVFRTFPIATSVDYCFLRAKKRKNPVFELLDVSIRRMSTLNSTCPIKSPIIFKDFRLESNFVPNLIPNGIYKGIVHFYMWDSGKPELLAKFTAVGENKIRLGYED